MNGSNKEGLICTFPSIEIYIGVALSSSFEQLPSEIHFISHKDHTSIVFFHLTRIL
uniref:Uncharacterized protein n=1 Tax=Rhizophora mucronata TaxID=61149 RepID=A0A2P2QJS9_RHIMU